MENKENTILETEEKIEIEEVVAEEMTEETTEEKKEGQGFEYPITVNVKSNGISDKLTIEEDKITIGERVINKADILLVNRFISMRNFKVEPTFTVVYKIDENSVTSVDFIQDMEIKDIDFDDKLAFWLKTEEIHFEENDWNYFCPIVNGYLTYRYVDTKKTEDLPREISAVSMGVSIAGLLIAIFGGVMLGMGKTTFGAIGLALGVGAFFLGIIKIFKKRK